MRAAVAESVGSVSVQERSEPVEPGGGEVLLAPEAVGVCGSDYHFFLGELSAEAGGDQFPRVLGHEIGARIVAVGEGCPPDLAVGSLVSVWPLIGCGNCYPCSIGRPNVCASFNLIGIHLDGGLQQRVVVPASQVFPIAVEQPAVAAIVEPLSIAVQAARRGRLAAGERAVIFGGGAIGQCIALVAREYGASALVVDLQESRLEVARSERGRRIAVGAGADGASRVMEAARDWGGRGGPPVVFDATGAASAVAAMLDIVSRAGRAVQVGMSNQELRVRLGVLTEKELDFLGVSCCSAESFAEAVRIAERNTDALRALVSHEFELERFPEALRFAIDNPTEALKVVIRNA